MLMENSIWDVGFFSFSSYDKMMGLWIVFCMACSLRQKGWDGLNGYLIFLSRFVNTAYLPSSLNIIGRVHSLVRYGGNSKKCSIFLSVSPDHKVFIVPNELLMSCQLLMQIEKEAGTEELTDIQLKCDTA